MIPVEATAAVLLCAGLSQRFGAENKLRASLGGRPLVSHAAAMLASLPFANHLAVVGRDPLEGLLPGFTLAANPKPEAGQDGSVRIGIDAALQTGVAAVLICLGDTPYLTAAHLAALTCAGDAETAVVSFAGWRSPPLLLPSRIARKILEQSHQPVRESLAQSPLVEVPVSPELLRDFDTPLDFAQG